MMDHNLAFLSFALLFKTLCQLHRIQLTLIPICKVGLYVVISIFY